MSLGDGRSQASIKCRDHGKLPPKPPEDMAEMRFFSDFFPAAVKSFRTRYYFGCPDGGRRMDEGLDEARASKLHPPFLIGTWLVEPDNVRLTKDGRPVKLEPKVMDLLVYLAQRPGRVLAREELEQAIWTGTVVGYDALTSAIIKLRKAFGDDSHRPWLIETVAKKGYRLIAPVTEPDRASLSPAPAPEPVSRNRRRPAMAALAAVALAAVGVAWFAFDRLASRASRIPSIAVLPFANLSGDSKFEYFSDGITEDIITDLSKLSGLLVIARNSAFAYKDQPLALKSVAEALGVRYVLEGSVRRSGSEIRINAKLIDSETGSHLWTERYDRRVQDIFAVQDDVTSNIVKALALTLTEEEKQSVARRYTHSIEAYDLLLNGQSFYARSNKEDNAHARQLYLRAIRLDPAFARAHAALALTHAEDSRYGWSADPAASMKQALDLARRAVALDDAIPQTYWALGYVYVTNKQFNEGVAAAERAIVLDPNHADAYTTLAYGRVYQGRPQEAIPLVRKAMRLNPRYPSQYPSILGRAYYHLGRYEEAAETLRLTVEMNPGRIAPQLYLALSYVALDKLDDARWEVDQILVHDPSFSLATVDHTIPIADPRELARMKDDLRRAGLN
jgi:TolB-like protein/DNA-binding winged helix-turn-helix (wHTH) protein